jgi:hypothetical protein
VSTLSASILAAPIFAAVLTSLAGVASAQANATVCYVHVDKPCIGAGANLYFRPNQWFADVDGIANLNARRCLARAAEYRGWCDPLGKQVTVHTLFNVGGKNIIGTVVGPEGVEYIFDGLTFTLTGHKK